MLIDFNLFFDEELKEFNEDNILNECFYFLKEIVNTNYNKEDCFNIVDEYFTNDHFIFSNLKGTFESLKYDGIYFDYLTDYFDNFKSNKWGKPRHDYNKIMVINCMYNLLFFLRFSYYISNKSDNLIIKIVIDYLVKNMFDLLLIFYNENMVLTTSSFGFWNYFRSLGTARYSCFTQFLMEMNFEDVLLFDNPSPEKLQERLFYAWDLKDVKSSLVSIGFGLVLFKGDRDFYSGLRGNFVVLYKNSFHDFNEKQSYHVETFDYDVISEDIETYRRECYKNPNFYEILLLNSTIEEPVLGIMDTNYTVEKTIKKQELLIDGNFVKKSKIVFLKKGNKKIFSKLLGDYTIFYKK